MDAVTTARRRRSPRDLMPAFARELAYELSPARARRWRALPGIERVPYGGRAVLTFDDGPDPDATPRVLERLAELRVRATFFVLGEQVERHPQLAGELVRAGHELGLHGYRHLRVDRAGEAEAHEDFERGLRTVEAVTGTRPRWYRPPYGKLGPATASACAEHGLQTVYWSVWGLDWEPRPSARIAQRVCRGLDDGAIVLLHDSARYARRPNAESTADALAPIVAAGTARGIAFVPLGQALAQSAP